MNKSALSPVPNGLPAVEIVKARFKRLPRGVIQVGAHNGREVKKLLRSGVDRAVFIDPLDETFGQLENRIDEANTTLASGHDDKFVAIQSVIGDEDGKTVKFNISSNTGESSSFLSPGSHTDIKPDIHFAEQRQLTMRTLDKLLPEKGLVPSNYDMMFIDTQGAEKHVLMGALEQIKYIDFLWLEVSIGGIYQGDTPISRFVVFLEALGFELGHCELKRFGWGDALFVRRSVFIGQE